MRPATRPNRQRRSEPAGLLQVAHTGAHTGARRGRGLLLPLLATLVCAGPGAQAARAQADAREPGAQSMQAAGSTTGSPVLDVTRAGFGAAAGCEQPARADGTADSTCALRAALRASAAGATPGHGRSVIYLPKGRYVVGAGDTGYAALFTLSPGVTVEGDASGSTEIVNESAHASTFLVTGDGSRCQTDGACMTMLRDLTLTGQGHTTNSTGVEVMNATAFFMQNVTIDNFGGIALNMTGSAERDMFDHLELSNDQLAVKLDGDTNENYFYRVNVIDPGQDSGSWCYSRRNCVHGHPSTGVHLPDYTPAVQLDGVNVHWLDSSIKATQFDAGVRFVSGESDSLEGNYIEGFVMGGINPGVQVIGAAEIGRLTAPISASAMVIPVDDALYQPLYESDPALVDRVGTHSYVNAYAILPSDYQEGDMHELSRDCRGAADCHIYRGTRESLTMKAFTADGNGYVMRRGAQPQAWPAGAVIEQYPNSTYGGVGLLYNHFGSMLAGPQSGTICHDTQPLADWVGNPSSICGEVLVGPVPDGYLIPYPSSSVYVHTTDSIFALGNSQFFQQPSPQSEAIGQGYYKVASNGTVLLQEGVAYGLASQYAPAGDIANNTLDHIAYVKWPGRTALGYYRDFSTGIEAVPSSNYYRQRLLSTPGSPYNQSEEEVQGNACMDAMPEDGTAVPHERLCNTPAGLVMQSNTGDGWRTGFSAFVGPVTVTAGAGLGRPAAAPAISGVVSDFVLTMQTAGAGRAGATGFTLGWHTPSPPGGCTLTPRSPAAAAVSGAMHEGTPDNAGDRFIADSTWPAGTYSWHGVCR